MKEVNRSNFLIKPFLKRNNLRASYQIICTIIPIIYIWLIIYQIINHPSSLLIKGFLLTPTIFLLTLFSSRTFSLMHDCGHNSLFTKSKLNRFFGFLLGLVNGIPQKSWSIDHAFHHRNNGNWEIYKGPIDVLTLELIAKSLENSLFFVFTKVSPNISFIKLKIIIISPNLGFKTK